MKELWKDIPEYEGLYQASSRGQIKRIIGYKCLKERLLKQRLQHSEDTGRGNYWCVELCKDGRVRKHKVHRLILETFVGPRQHKQETRHLDGVVSNNWLSNLKYGTKSENTYDSVRHGTHIDIRGSKHHLAKLTEERVLQIRQLLKDGQSGVMVAKQFCISTTSVSDIKLRKIWTHI